MNEIPVHKQTRPVAVYLTATGRSYVFVWSLDDRPDGIFQAGCNGCGWAVETPSSRKDAEESASDHAHYCHYLPFEHWPEHVRHGE